MEQRSRSRECIISSFFFFLPCVCPCTVYDVLTGAVVSKLLGHGACVRDVTWHPYEDIIISSSVSGTSSSIFISVALNQLSCKKSTCALCVRSGTALCKCGSIGKRTLWTRSGRENDSRRKRGGHNKSSALQKEPPRPPGIPPHPHPHPHPHRSQL